jgi:flagellar hook-length control protein FliK
MSASAPVAARVGASARLYARAANPEQPAKTGQKVDSRAPAADAPAARVSQTLAAQGAHAAGMTADASPAMTQNARATARLHAAQATARTPGESVISELAQRPGAENTPISNLTAAATPPSSVAARADMLSQIADGFRASLSQGDQSVTVHLHPAELGSVKLVVQAEGDVLHGRLEVSNRATLDDIRTETPALLNRLNESGISLHRIDVVLSGQGSSSTPQYGQEQASASLSQQAQQQGQGARREHANGGAFVAEQSVQTAGQGRLDNAEAPTGALWQSGQSGQINLWM